MPTRKKAATRAARRAVSRGERTAATADALTSGVRAAKADKRARVNMARRQKKRGETTKGAVRAVRREERKRVSTARAARKTAKKRRRAGVKAASVSSLKRGSSS